MNVTAEEFIEQLVEKFPNLLPLLLGHLDDNFGELLPHVFFGDVTRYVVDGVVRAGRQAGPARDQAEREPRELIDALESAVSSGDREITNLIMVSFLENVPDPGERGAEVRALLGPMLSQRLEQMGLM